MPRCNSGMIRLNNMHTRRCENNISTVTVHTRNYIYVLKRTVFKKKLLKCGRVAIT